MTKYQLCQNSPAQNIYRWLYERHHFDKVLPKTKHNAFYLDFVEFGKRRNYFVKVFYLYLMNQLNWKFLLFSFVAAVVVLYIVFSNQEGATQEEIRMNALGGGIGMVVGLYIYNRFIKKDDGNSPDLGD